MRTEIWAFTIIDLGGYNMRLTPPLPSAERSACLPAPLHCSPPPIPHTAAPCPDRGSPSCFYQIRSSRTGSLAHRHVLVRITLPSFNSLSPLGFPYRFPHPTILRPLLSSINLPLWTNHVRKLSVIIRCYEITTAPVLRPVAQHPS